MGSTRRKKKIKYGVFDTKWLDVYGEIGGKKRRLFTTRTECKNIIPGLTIFGLGQVRYGYGGKVKENVKTKVADN